MSLIETPSHYILPIFFFLIFTITTTAQTPFTCKSTTTKCTSLIEYITPNDTTISNISTLFNISNNLYSFLGANNLPSNTLPSSPIKAKQSLRIPFPCRCSNGTGTSDGVPVYTVVPDDGLYHIAAEVYANLVTFPEIQRANNIPDPNQILVGQRLVIPLPCSCDDVDDDTVVHYGHVVPPRSSVEGIAKEFGTTEETLLRLNNLSSPNDLKADSVLDVPLKACRSHIRNTSPDYSTLRVPNGSYVFTANNCVQCRCDAANNYTLQCQESGIRPSNTWPSCPRTECRGSNLRLGNTTSSSCDRTTCDYEGFDNGIIFTSANNSTCKAPAGASSAATTISSQGWRWNFFLIAVQLTVLSLHLFQ